MKIRVYFLTLAFAAGLAACRGTNAMLPFSQSNAVAGAMRTTAWGILVDDPSGKPLAHEPVTLYPWKPCRYAPPYPVISPYPGEEASPTPYPQPVHLTCPTAVTHTTTASNGRFELRAPPGHYLLTIGSDSSTDLVRPTIHDNVTLTGGTQHLLAPSPCPTFYPAPPGAPAPGHCLPAIPLVTPAPPERNGNYRLSTLTKPEVTCIKAFDAFRLQYNVDPAIVDEWLTENDRAQEAEFKSKNPIAYGNGALTEGFGFQDAGSLKPSGGHSGCWLWVMKFNVFSLGLDGLPFSADPRTHWVATTYVPRGKYYPKGNTYGFAEYPRDPRSVVDPLVRYWP